MGQQPSGQRRRRRLAMRAGQHDGARAPEEVIANGLRQRAVADLALEHRLELDVSARNRVPDHDEVDVGRDVVGGIAGHGPDVFRGEEVAHRRVDVLVGSADIMPAPLQQRGQCGHRRSAHADQVNALAVFCHRNQPAAGGRQSAVPSQPTQGERRIDLDPLRCATGATAQLPAADCVTQPATPPRSQRDGNRP